MDDTAVMHLGLKRKALEGATLAIVPGDPFRVPKIAALCDSAKPLAHQREYCSYLGRLGEHPVLICSTGIGGPATSICLEELAMLGITTFIRAGTTGAIQPHIAIGDLIVSQASVRLDGASLHYAPPEFPAVADFHLTQALVMAAKAKGKPWHVGVTASSDTFYPGQERYDTFTGRVTRRFQGSMQEWQDLGVLNYEMETASLFTIAAALGLKAGAVLGVIANRTQSEAIDHDKAVATVDTTIQVALAAARHCLEESL